MAKDINFSAARLVYVSLMHVLNNAYKFGLHGTLKALRSPDVKPLIDGINPVKAAEKKKKKGKKSSRRDSSDDEDADGDYDEQDEDDADLE